MTLNSRVECERHVVTLGEGISMAFRRIPACPHGFMMGNRGYDSNEEPIHRVVIPDSFWLGESPVTQAQFAVWTRMVGLKHFNHHTGSPELPAESMSWNEANDFCNWLTNAYRDQFPQDGCIASLPRESQWEYACRGDTTGKKPLTDYSTGDGIVALQSAGSYVDNSGGSTHAVRKKPPNTFGLYDMHGNVWEWCLDRWDASAYRRRWEGITDLETFQMAEEFGDRSDGQSPVQRGGSCWYAASRCSAAFRNGGLAGYHIRFIGFRVCLVRSPTISQSDSGSLTRTASERLEDADVARKADKILDTNFEDPLSD